MPKETPWYRPMAYQRSQLREMVGRREFYLVGERICRVWEVSAVLDSNTICPQPPKIGRQNWYRILLFHFQR